VTNVPKQFKTLEKKRSTQREGGGIMVKIPFVKTADGSIYHDECYDELLLDGVIENPEKTERLTSETDDLVICDYCN